jgi:hypothetical protein
MRCIFSLGVFLSVFALAQSDRGTITGTVTDPAGAVVASAPIQARNVDTGVAYQSETSATGNYTIPQLPVGSYEVSVSVPGFKKFVRTGLQIQATQTVRIDVALEVGSSTESWVSAERFPAVPAFAIHTTWF